MTLVLVVIVSIFGCIIGCSVDLWDGCPFSGANWNLPSPGDYSYRTGDFANDIVNSWKIYSSAGKECCVDFWDNRVGSGGFTQCASYGYTTEVDCMATNGISEVTLTESTLHPTDTPSNPPTMATSRPSSSPSNPPSSAPSNPPSSAPSNLPTMATSKPSSDPSTPPTSSEPSSAPSNPPTTPSPSSDTSNAPTVNHVKTDREVTSTTMIVLVVVVSLLSVFWIVLVVYIWYWCRQQKQEQQLHAQDMQTKPSDQSDKIKSNDTILNTNACTINTVHSNPNIGENSDNGEHSNTNTGETDCETDEDEDESLYVIPSECVTKEESHETAGDTKGRTAGNTTQRDICSECGIAKFGKTFEGDGLFYCDDCWAYYGGK
eukprot:79225_1